MLDPLHNLWCDRHILTAVPEQSFQVAPERAGERLDQFLVSRLEGVSRSRVQQLIEQQKVLVNGATAKASLKLRGDERVRVTGEVDLPPLRAMAEDIPLDVVYEDDDLAVINKPAGMQVHAGAGATEDARNRGTLVNALLHRFNALSEVGGELRPGIVHRLDKETSGLIVVAKNDAAHYKLARQFSGRQVKKTYIALVQGWPKLDAGTIDAPISRDMSRRTRMTTRGVDGRSAVSHYKVLEKFQSAYGKFALVEVKIETGRTHQIRVHMASMGHPVVGDTLYGAAGELNPGNPGRTVGAARALPRLSLDRNFLHAARVEFAHPASGKALSFEAPLPGELVRFMDKVKERADSAAPETSI
jgi:23S rRNA pseudouridine1911/1915/1917 synthase